jgi:hypothetical protein
MSNENDKFRHSKRLHKEESAIQRQVDILKHYVSETHPQLKQPHRLSKKHGMNCGNPSCILCANPRKVFKDLTIQEKRFNQNIDDDNDRHSNGAKRHDEKNIL